MRILVSAWLFLLNFILPLAHAQESLPVFELSQRMEGELLGRNLLIREDSDSSLSIDDILLMNDADFQPSVQAIPNFGFKRSAMWVRFYLKNTGSKPQSVILEYGYPSADELDFFFHDKAGNLKKRLNGDRRSPKQRDIAYRLPSFRVSVPPGQHVYHLRLQTEGVARIPIRLWSVTPFQDKRSNEMAFLAFLYGFLFVMMFYNIFVALMTQNKGYIYYVLFIASSILVHAGAQAIYVSFLPGHWTIPLCNEIYVVSTGLGSTLSALFTIKFLNLKKRLYSFHIILGINAALGLLVALVTPLSYNLGAKISTMTAMILAFSILVASIIRCLQKYRPAYFFMTAWLISLVGTIANSLANAEVLEVNFFTTWGQFLGVSIEVVLLSLAMGDKMRLAVENSARAIKELNESLERKVEEKTRDIRSILANIKLGIFTIVTEDLLVDREYSASLEDLLGQDKLAGRKAMQLLFERSSLSGNEISLMESTLIASLDEDPFQFETNDHTLVRELQHLDSKGSTRTWELDWSLMLDRRGLVEKYLVTCRDVTELRRYQAAVKVQQKELDYIGELVANPALSTEKFFHNAERFLEENLRLIQHNPDIQTEVLKVLFINMHTIKGTARALGFRDLAALTHDVEQNLANIQRKVKTWEQQSLLQDLWQVIELVKTYKRINEEKLGRSQHIQDTMQLKRTDFQDELAILETLEHTSDARLINNGIARLRNRIMEKVFHSAEGFFQEATACIPQLASDLGKTVPRIRCHVAGILFASETVEALEGAFVHILRNTMDHGIESARDRSAAGKNAEGTIEIVAEERAEGLFLLVQDDGRGLALKKIEKLAKERGILQAEHKLTAIEIAQLIFESGFSTRQELSDISGRGVGMDAVRQFLTTIGGSASIELLQDNALTLTTRDFMPFRLVLFIPHSRYHRVALAIGA